MSLGLRNIVESDERQSGRTVVPNVTHKRSAGQAHMTYGAGELPQRVVTLNRMLLGGIEASELVLQRTNSDSIPVNLALLQEHYPW